MERAAERVIEAYLRDFASRSGKQRPTDQWRSLVESVRRSLHD
jgi:hypothetical protein